MIFAQKDLISFLLVNDVNVKHTKQNPTVILFKLLLGYHLLELFIPCQEWSVNL